MSAACRPRLEVAERRRQRTIDGVKAALADIRIVEALEIRQRVVKASCRHDP